MQLVVCPAVLSTTFAHKVHISFCHTFTSFHPFKLRSEVFRQHTVTVKHVLELFSPSQLTLSCHVQGHHCCQNNQRSPLCLRFDGWTPLCKAFAKHDTVTLVFRVCLILVYNKIQTSEVYQTQLRFIIIKALFSFFRID
jgi:hypothetical protein